jgi:hypothetical protein
MKSVRILHFLHARLRSHARDALPAIPDAGGFALIETVIALAILAFVSVSVMGLLTSGITSLSLSRQKTIAEQLAAAQIESIRQLPYSSVGTTAGNPRGTVTPSQSISTNGLRATETVQIKWVNDPAPTAFTSYADYKQVVVTVQRASDSKVLSKQTTFVGPANTSSYGGVTLGIVKAQVVDMGNSTPAAGVTVSLGTGPSAPLSDTTDATGTVIFPALTPTSGSGYYDLSLTPPAGYVALSDDVSPSAAAHFHLSAGQTFPTVLRIYEPSTVYVQVLSGGVTYPGAASVTITSSEPTLTASWNGSASPLTGVVSGVQYTATATLPNGLTSDPVVQTVPNAYPTDLTSSFALTVPNLWVTVKSKASGTCRTVSGATVTVKSGSTVVAGPDTTNSSGLVGFAVPGGATYTIAASKSSLNGSASSTVAVAPNTTSATVSISGTCP